MDWLQFVQCLSNPYYLQYLAAEKYLDNEEFIAYLEYLQYFQEPKYLKYLQYVNWRGPRYSCLLNTNDCSRYPGPTLRALELLQEERFRKEIIIPAVVEAMVNSGIEAAANGAG